MALGNFWCGDFPENAGKSIPDGFVLCVYPNPGVSDLCGVFSSRNGFK